MSLTGVLVILLHCMSGSLDGEFGTMKKRMQYFISLKSVYLGSVCLRAVLECAFSTISLSSEPCSQRSSFELASLSTHPQRHYSKAN